MSKEYIKAQTPLPAYFPYPKFLLQMSLSHTARLTYVLLLDRMTLSQKNGWVDVQGRAYVLYPLAGLAEDLQSSISSVTRALRELEAARLIERRSNGFSKPNQVFLSFPSTAQKCTVEMVKNEQPDCSKVSNAVAQNCTPTLYFYCASCHVSISEKDLWNGINKELHQRMEEHRDLQNMVRKSSGKSKLQSKEITTKRKIEQVMGNVVRLESQKRSGYEQYVLGKLSKEKFLELKQGLENEITTLKQTKAEKEKELAVVQEELQRKKQIAGSTEVLLTADNLQQYVKKIEVDRGKITYTEFLL